MLREAPLGLLARECNEKRRASRESVPVANNQVLSGAKKLDPKPDKKNAALNSDEKDFIFLFEFFFKIKKNYF